MALEVDDLDLFDFVETVEVHARGPATGDPTTHTGVKALFRYTTTPTAAGSVEMGIDHVRVHIQASTIPAAPLRNWKIKQTNGTYWLIKNTSTMSYGTRYVCECVKMED